MSTYQMTCLSCVGGNEMKATSYFAVLSVRLFKFSVVFNTVWEREGSMSMHWMAGISQGLPYASCLVLNWPCYNLFVC